MESLQTHYEMIIRDLFDAKNSHYRLAGFFLTSSQQKGKTQDQLAESISESFALTVPTQVITA